MEGARIFGVVSQSGGRRQVAYLRKTLPITDEVLHLADPVRPPEVFRIAAFCAGAACQHFDGVDCRLAKRTVALLAPVVDRLPACEIRPHCRWWRQEGVAACLRCPQVITENWNPTESEVAAAGDEPSPGALPMSLRESI